MGTPLSANDMINLDDAPETNVSNISDEQKKLEAFTEIVKNNSTFEIISECETCSKTLRNPILAISSEDIEGRDSNIVCDDCA